MPEQASGFVEVDLSFLASKVSHWGGMGYVLWMVSGSEQRYRGGEAATQDERTVTYLY
jgi:hypothetical protein